MLAVSLFGLVSEVKSAVAHSTLIKVDASRPGRIDPKVFGNFVELLDDVVPAMWAEMLNDRSFEGVTPLAKWCYYDGMPDFCDREWETNSTWSLDGDWVFNGKKSATLLATPAKGAYISQSGLSLKKGMDYTFTGYFRDDTSNLKITVLLRCQHPNGEWINLSIAPITGVTRDWRKQTVVLHSTGESEKAVFELRIEGAGRLWADKLSLMPNDNVQGWRKDVVEVIKEVHPAIIRWGGSVVDPGEYRWKNGIGDRFQRVPFPNKNWGRIDSNDVGIDEFCQLCELVGAEPLMCVSFSDGAQSAADLVDYCNGPGGSTWGSKRVINGHLSGYNVKYWQIGNEINGDDPRYLQEFGDFVAYMRRIDPGLQILTSYPGQNLMTRYNTNITFISPHHYTRDLAGCEREFNILSKMIDTIPGCDKIQIAVTEWNVSGGDWGLARGKQQTLLAAIQNARYLHVMMRHSDKVKIACRSNLANSFCGAVIETRLSGVLKRPSYYAMQLYARHAKPVPVAVEVTGDNPDLFACASEDRKTATVFAINSKNEPVTWSFRFEAGGMGMRQVSAECLHDVLDAGQAEVMNHWDVPERVKITPITVSNGEVVLPPLSLTVIEYSLD